ncbi:2,3-bisphosphoglycerate-independent phosphoglycerate mutase, partial [Halomonas alkalicola]
TADHGNAEQMVNPETGNPQTAHTTFAVPLIYVGPRPARLQEDGSLCDIAPTLLTLMDQPVPEEMTGRVLVDFDAAS